jgi:hypothetical protein
MQHDVSGLTVPPVPAANLATGIWLDAQVKFAAIY